jgi:hypothetical protein
MANIVAFYQTWIVFFQSKVKASTTAGSALIDEMDALYAENELFVDNFPFPNTILDFDDDVDFREGTEELTVFATTSHSPLTEGCLYCADFFWATKRDDEITETVEGQDCAVYQGGEEP